MQNMSNLEADGLQQQKTTSGSTNVSQEQKAEAALGTGSSKNWTIGDEKNVAWSDESLRRTDGRVRIWCQQHEFMDPTCLVSTVQAVGGGVMVWQMFSWHTLGLLITIIAWMTQPIWVLLHGPQCTRLLMQRYSTPRPAGCSVCRLLLQPCLIKPNVTNWLIIWTKQVKSLVKSDCVAHGWCLRPDGRGVEYRYSNGYLQYDNAPYVTVAGSETNRAPLLCGRTGDLQYDKSAEIAWSNHVNMKQNLKGIFWITSWKHIICGKILYWCK